MNDIRASIDAIELCKWGEHKKKISVKEARGIGDRLGVDWDKIDISQFVMGLRVELEHTNVTHGDMLATGRIALAHLEEIPNYYTYLKDMEDKYKEAQSKDRNKGTGVSSYSRLCIQVGLELLTGVLDRVGEIPFLRDNIELLQSNIEKPNLASKCRYLLKQMDLTGKASSMNMYTYIYYALGWVARAGINNSEPQMCISNASSLILDSMRGTKWHTEIMKERERHIDILSKMRR